MKTYTQKELKSFIRSEISKAYNKNLVFCRSKHDDSGPLCLFIRIETPIRYEAPWHGTIQNLKPGDYLHANTSDIYAISAASFENCYTKVNLCRTIAP